MTEEEEIARKEGQARIPSAGRGDVEVEVIITAGGTSSIWPAYLEGPADVFRTNPTTSSDSWLWASLASR